MAFFLHLLHTLAIGIGVSTGILKTVVYRRPGAELMGLWILLFYGLLVVGMFGIDAMFRSTVIALPAIVMLAGYSFSDVGRARPTLSSS